MSDDLVFAPATELAERIRSKSVSPTEVMEAHLARIESVNPKLNAIVTPDETAMDQARDAEDALMRGELRGPLHGVPFTAKDSVDVGGLRTTRGSRFFEDHVPDADAVVITRLKDAGAVFLGHTNVPEFVFWFETDNDVFGRTENPWKHGRTTGGSSGGEAAALSAGMSPLGIGSDVGCSIRLPAAYCGIVGLKPTHGRVPLTGHWPDAILRFMHVGPMARTVKDVAVALSLLSGPDGLDPYAMPVPVPAFDRLDGPVRGLRVGWCSEGPFAPVSGEIQAAVAGAAIRAGGDGLRGRAGGLEGVGRATGPGHLALPVRRGGRALSGPDDYRPPRDAVRPASQQAHRYQAVAGRVPRRARQVRASAPGVRQVLLRIRHTPLPGERRTGPSMQRVGAGRGRPRRLPGMRSEHWCHSI